VAQGDFPDVVEYVSAHCKGVGPDGFKGPFRHKSFYDSMILFTF